MFEFTKSLFLLYIHGIEYSYIFSALFLIFLSLQLYTQEVGFQLERFKKRHQKKLYFSLVVTGLLGAFLPITLKPIIYFLVWYDDSIKPVRLSWDLLSISSAMFSILFLFCMNFLVHQHRDNKARIKKREEEKRKQKIREREIKEEERKTNEKNAYAEKRRTMCIFEILEEHRR